jgi:hypothetical protein
VTTYLHKYCISFHKRLTAYLGHFISHATEIRHQITLIKNGFEPRWLRFVATYGWS